MFSTPYIPDLRGYIILIMCKLYCLIGFILFYAVKTSGQCPDPPVISLSSVTGNTCGKSTVSVIGTFGGRATSVEITENGHGQVTPEKSSESPFTFTYTPNKDDMGKQITITVTTNNPPGRLCDEATITYTLTISASPPAPEISLITQPTCLVPSGSVVLNRLPDQEKWTLTRSPDETIITGTGVSTTVSGLNAGNYSFRVTNSGGCNSPSSAEVDISSLERPVARAGPDKILDNLFETNLEAVSAGSNETGSWSVISGPALLAEQSDANTFVRNLAPGRNIFVWTLSNNVCPPSFDSVIVMVNVKKPVFPTLITPNMDGRNDNFVVRWDEMTGKTELVILDRSGIQVYKNMNYDNRWDGVDYNDNPLPDGTYFYLLKTEFGKAVSGFIVIKR